MTDPLNRPRDAAAIAVFRMAFGLLVSISAARHLAYGWVDELFIRPRFHFSYAGLGWIPQPSGPLLHALFVLLIVLGVVVAVGLFYRAAITTLFVVFTWVQLLDVSAYLNHYYLVSLFALLLCFIPAHVLWSVDARRRPELASTTLPAWCTWLLRFQVAVVYVFAGLAKLTADWLLEAQPLNIWLSARTDFWLIGPLFAERWVAYVAAWFGFLFDTTIVFFLMTRRTRPYAYAVVVLFHAATAALFPIGMFPVIMTVAALVFFDSWWPRRWLRATQARPAEEPRARFELSSLGLAALLLWAAVQVLMPLRTHLHGGNVLWHEQGLRFSWRVMAREKNGSVTFIVRDAAGREQHVPPTRYLNRLQEREMSVQPDLIVQLAKVIARDLSQLRGHPVTVHADAWVSLNGRPMQRFIDPGADLSRVDDVAGVILPAPGDRPPALARR